MLGINFQQQSMNQHQQLNSLRNNGQYQAAVAEQKSAAGQFSQVGTGEVSLDTFSQGINQMQQFMNQQQQLASLRNNGQYQAAVAEQKSAAGQFSQAGSGNVGLNPFSQGINQMQQFMNQQQQLVSLRNNGQYQAAVAEQKSDAGQFSQAGSGNVGLNPFSQGINQMQQSMNQQQQLASLRNQQQLQKALHEQEEFRLGR